MGHHVYLLIAFQLFAVFPLGFIIQQRWTIEYSVSSALFVASMANFFVFATLVVNFGLLAFCTSEKCQLPPSSGTCDTSSVNWTGIQTKFYYSAINFNCAEFPYSGCGGNANNFETREECMSECGRNGTALIASKINSALNSTKCWYNDQLYSLGEEIEATLKDNPCAIGCYCSRGGSNDTPQINCMEVDCPEELEDRTHCVSIYDQNSCCPEYRCDGSSTTHNAGNATSAFKCKYLNKEYVEGQGIFPEDYPCFSCVCNRNFTGEINTDVCQESNCGIKIYHQFELANQCEPVYYQTSGGRTSCCPSHFNCSQQ